MGYNEQELDIPIDELVVLSGTLTTPDVKEDLSTVIVFVAGSGPIDRDENANGIKLNVFNTLARALAEGKQPGASQLADDARPANAATTLQQHPSFRYDKRGTGKSKGTFITTGVSDLFQDLIAVLDYFVNNKGTTRFVLIGHSEGTLLSAMASAKRPDIKGLILICPFVTPMEDILIQQGKSIDKMQAEATGISGWLQRSITRCFTGGSVESFQSQLIRRIHESQTDTIRVMLFNTLPAKWFREHFAMDYSAVFQTVQAVSVLLLVAECDVQCNPQDGERILQLLPTQGKLQVLSRLSHLLRLQSEEKRGFADYGEQLKTTEIDPTVVAAVVKWCSEFE